MTASTGGSTSELQTRAGVRAAAVLDDVPDEGAVPGSVRVPLTLVRRFSGAGLAVPELPHVARPRDPGADPRRGAAARQRRGLAGAVRTRAERDRRPRAFRIGRAAGARGQAAGCVPRARGSERGSSSTRPSRGGCSAVAPGFDRPRLGYREVAASTNRMTLIAAIVPAGAVTTHTIFCLREPRDQALHWFLCGVFNSFVANYLIRLRGGTHVPAAVIHQLPVPVLARDSQRLRAHRPACRARRRRSGRRRPPGRAAGARHAQLRTRRATISRTCSTRFRSSPEEETRRGARRVSACTA